MKCFEWYIIVLFFYLARYICTCIAGFTGDTCSNIIVNSCNNNGMFN